MSSSLEPLFTFKEQFSFSPKIENDTLTQGQYTSILVCGMGGSGISTTLLKTLFPDLPLTLHNTYGIPKKVHPSTLIILSSYSGNTEEVLESYERATKESLSCAVVTQGGELLTRAEKDGVPYIKIPETSLEPRFSIGYQMIALLTLLDETKKILALQHAVEKLDIQKIDIKGKELAHVCGTTYPVIYSAQTLSSVGYLIKAAINEGAKTPSFSGIIPESDHNELQSFVTDDTRNESKHFSFLFIPSSYDHERIAKRFSVMENLLTERGFSVQKIPADHTSLLSVLEATLTGYFMATYMAIGKDIDPYTTPLIQAFKKEMLH